jgi:hypothetical protein
MTVYLLGNFFHTVITAEFVGQELVPANREHWKQYKPDDMVSLKMMTQTAKMSFNLTFDAIFNITLHAVYV